MSSNVDPFALPVVKERWKKNIELVEVQKPSSVEHYDKYMGGDDHSDQLWSYYNTCCSFHKWYKYLFWSIFDLSVCNAFILFEENVPQPGRTLVACRLAFAKQLIAGYSSHSDKTKWSQKAASLGLATSPENAHEHFLTRRKGKAQKRHCGQCKNDRRKTASDWVRETVYKCAQCRVALCKDPCFLHYHTLYIIV